MKNKLLINIYAKLYCKEAIKLGNAVTGIDTFQRYHYIRLYKKLRFSNFYFPTALSGIRDGFVGITSFLVNFGSQ